MSVQPGTGKVWVSNTEARNNVPLDGDDCAPGDADTWATTGIVTSLTVDANSPGTLTWDEQATVSGPSVRYDVISGLVSELRSVGPTAASSCLAGDLDEVETVDLRPDPPTGDGYFYLVQANNPCVTDPPVDDRQTLYDVSCSIP